MMNTSLTMLSRFRERRFVMFFVLPLLLLLMVFSSSVALSPRRRVAHHEQHDTSSIITNRMNDAVDEYNTNGLLRRQIQIEKEDDDENGNIVGGNTVYDKDLYPYYAAPLGSGILCGAVLIERDILLTAAHCKGGFTRRTVHLGSTTLDGRDATEFIITDYEYPNPNYNAQDIEQDIMLVKLTEPSTKIRPIQLNYNTTIPIDNTYATVIGYGTLKYRGDRSNTLQQVSVPIVNTNTTCQNAYGDLNEQYVLCAGEEGKDACQGDSGGPLIQNNVLLGTVSFGYQCARAGFPGVYARISGMKNFIEQAICDMSSYAPLGCIKDPNFTPPENPIRNDDNIMMISVCEEEHTCTSLGFISGRTMKLDFLGLFCFSTCIPFIGGLLRVLGWGCGTCL